MILINKERLEVGEALNNKQHKLNTFAKVYDDTMKFLRERYPEGVMHFYRPDRPRKTKGANAKGREVPNMSIPVEPISIPLSSTQYVEGTYGKNTWACCLDAPTLLPNGLWDMGAKRSMQVKRESYSIDINREPDLAFFLYKISPVMRTQFKLRDPVADDENIGAKEYLETQRKMAVWTMLREENKLRLMARAYGVNKVSDKKPNALRTELEALLKRNDETKKINPAVKGTVEFLEEMKITDGIMLRSFVQKALDENKVLFKPSTGDYRIGEKVIVRVPATETKVKFEFLCNYLMAGNNSEKLQEFVGDIVNKTYLEAELTYEEKKWLAKVAGTNPEHKRAEELDRILLEHYCPV